MKKHADRFYVIAHARTNGKLIRVYNTGTSSFHTIWAVASVGSYIVLKTTTGHYLVTAHDAAMFRDDNAHATMGPYLTFNNKNAAIMAAIMRATKG